MATVDIPGTSMQVDMDELIHMKWEGKLAKLLFKMKPKLYQKYIKIEKGKQALYVKLQKPPMAHSAWYSAWLMHAPAILEKAICKIAGVGFYSEAL